MPVVIHSFDVFEPLILPFDNRLSVLNFPRSSVFLLFYILVGLLIDTTILIIKNKYTRRYHSNSRTVLLDWYNWRTFHNNNLFHRDHINLQIFQTFIYHTVNTYIKQDFHKVKFIYTIHYNTYHSNILLNHTHTILTL